jgi:hypothetical protein
VRIALRAELGDAAMTVIEARNASEALWDSIEAVLSHIRNHSLDGTRLRLSINLIPIVSALVISIGF